MSREAGKAAWVGSRELPLQARGRRVMVRVDEKGVQLWLKGTRDKRLVSWFEIAMRQYSQVYTLREVAMGVAK